MDLDGLLKRWYTLTFSAAIILSRCSDILVESLFLERERKRERGRGRERGREREREREREMN